jgi:hypothetical protein
MLEKLSAAHLRRLDVDSNRSASDPLCGLEQFRRKGYNVHMKKRSGSVLGIMCIVMLAFAAANAPSLHAQHTVRSDTGKLASAPRTVARGPVSTATARPGAPRAKSLSQSVFDTPWVLFPTRLTIVIVFLAVAMLFLMSGCWGAVRFAHLLRHLEWKEPPRRLKRGELGAAGTSLGWEFEDRTSRDLAKDNERDEQIAALQLSVAALSRDQREIVSIFVSALKGEPGSNQ